MMKTVCHLEMLYLHTYHDAHSLIDINSYITRFEALINLNYPFFMFSLLGAIFSAFYNFEDLCIYFSY